MNVITNIAGRSYDLLFGIEKNSNEEDQYTAIITMHPPNSIQKAFNGELMTQIGKYIVETGSLDEISKYKEVGAFSEWPFFRLRYSTNRNQDLNDRDIDFVKWMKKTLEEYIPKPEMEAEYRKKNWWKRLLGVDQTRGS